MGRLLSGSVGLRGLVLRGRRRVSDWGFVLLVLVLGLGFVLLLVFVLLLGPLLMGFFTFWNWSSFKGCKRSPGWTSQKPDIYTDI